MARGICEILHCVQNDKIKFWVNIYIITIKIKKRKRGKFSRKFLFCLIVRLIGLEPTRIATPDPKSGASTNFATSAIVFANAMQR